MTLHLLKTAAGLQDIDGLAARQAGNRLVHEGAKAVYAYTRYRPKRADDILESGGSIYWILKHRIQVRQKILGFEDRTEKDGFAWCMIVLDPALIRTVAAPRRAIQGWRYLEGAKAPKDRGVHTAGDEDLSPEMEAELKALGLV